MATMRVDGRRQRKEGLFAGLLMGLKEEEELLIVGRCKWRMHSVSAGPLGLEVIALFFFTEK